jgi:hypothetical protein
MKEKYALKCIVIFISDKEQFLKKVELNAKSSEIAEILLDKTIEERISWISE